MQRKPNKPQILPNNKLPILLHTQLWTNSTTEQHYRGGSKAEKVSVLPLSGAIPSGDVGRAQIKAIPHRLKILQGWDKHSWMAATWNTLNEHWPHATYQRLPEVHMTGSFVLTQYVGHLSLGDYSVQARKIPDPAALRVLACYAGPVLCLLWWCIPAPFPGRTAIWEISFLLIPLLLLF